MVQIDENEDFSNMIIKTKVHMKCAIKILTEEFCSDGSIFYLCSLVRYGYRYSAKAYSGDFGMFRPYSRYV